MRISHKHKFVFLSKWKCGSESIRKMLDPYSDIYSTQRYPYYHHTNARSLKKHFDSQGWDWNDYFVFLTIRNPWEMLVSLYFYGLPDSDGEYYWDRHWEDIEKDNYFPQQRIIPENIISFDDWIKTYDLTPFSLNYFAYSDEGECLVNEVIKIENFHTKIDTLNNRLGLNLDSAYIPYINTSIHPDYQTFFSNKTILIVEEAFKSDIEAGEYSFEPKKRPKAKTGRHVFDYPLFISERNYLLKEIDKTKKEFDKIKSYLEEKIRSLEEERSDLVEELKDKGAIEYNLNSLQDRLSDFQNSYDNLLEEKWELFGQTNMLKRVKKDLEQRLADEKTEANRLSDRLVEELNQKYFLEKSYHKLTDTEKKLTDAEKKLAEAKYSIAWFQDKIDKLNEDLKKQEQLNEVLKSVLYEERHKRSFSNIIKRKLPFLFYFRSSTNVFKKMILEPRESFKKEAPTSVDIHHKMSSNTVPQTTNIASDKNNKPKKKLNKDTGEQYIKIGNFKGLILGHSWEKLINSVKEQIDELNLIFIPELELYLLDNDQLPDEDWTAIVHGPETIPEWMAKSTAYKLLSGNLFELDAWKCSMSSCRRLFVFSHEHAKSLSSLNIPITVLKYPLPTVGHKWSWDLFNSNPDKQIIQIGWWLMRMHAIYLLPNSNFKKLWIREPDNYLKSLFESERSVLKEKGIFFDYMDRSVNKCDNSFINAELQNNLCENIAFAHYYNLSTPETLLGIIAHQTPILINALPAIREYLGDDYPLYYYFYGDAVKKANDLNLIREANQYLISLSENYNQNLESFAIQIRKALSEN